jgi:hypothetical protein
MQSSSFTPCACKMQVQWEQGALRRLFVKVFYASYYHFTAGKATSVNCFSCVIMGGKPLGLYTAPLSGATIPDLTGRLTGDKRILSCI